MGIIWEKNLNKSIVINFIRMEAMRYEQGRCSFICYFLFQCVEPDLVTAVVKIRHKDIKITITV